MATISKEITIKAPPKEVYGFFEDPTHLPEIWPSMIEVTNVEKIPTGGYRYHWTYKMGGKKFTGDTFTEEFMPFERIVDKAEGDLDGTFDWKFVAENGWTKVKLDVTYTMPKSLLTTFAEPFLVKANEREAELVLTNLKERIEF